MSETDNQKSRRELQEERLPKYKKIIKGMWIATLAAFLAFIMIFVVLSFSDLPDTKELENPRTVLATEVYANDGSVLGRYFTENRVKIPFDSISPNVIEALIATEDERYFKHSGIDLEALLRVLVKTGLMGQKNRGGGSTITQQLAKNLFTEKPGSGLERVVH